MLLAIMLGIIVGASAVLLVQQALRGAFVPQAYEALPADRFPHLAPPRRRTGSWRRAA